jgi:hypothetical protein
MIVIQKPRKITFYLKKTPWFSSNYNINFISLYVPFYFVQILLVYVLRVDTFSLYKNRIKTNVKIFLGI